MYEYPGTPKSMYQKPTVDISIFRNIENAVSFPDESIQKQNIDITSYVVGLLCKYMLDNNVYIQLTSIAKQ